MLMNGLMVQKQQDTIVDTNNGIFSEYAEEGLDTILIKINHAKYGICSANSSNSTIDVETFLLYY